MNVVVKVKGEIDYIHHEESIENTPLFQNLIKSLNQFSKKYFDENFVCFQINSTFDKTEEKDTVHFINYFKMGETEIISCSNQENNMTEIYQEWAHAVLIDDKAYFKEKVDFILNQIRSENQSSVYL